MKGKKTLKKSNKTHSATNLCMKTKLSDNKGVRFFVIPVLAYSWRILSEFSDIIKIEVIIAIC
jgi:hypothetical protein